MIQLPVGARVAAFLAEIGIPAAGLGVALAVVGGLPLASQKHGPLALLFQLLLIPLLLLCRLLHRRLGDDGGQARLQLVQGRLLLAGTLADGRDQAGAVAGGDGHPVLERTPA